jgi:hypothetical protein
MPRAASIQRSQRAAGTLQTNKPFEVSNATDFGPERFETEARPVDPENGRSVTSPICWGKKKLEP